MNMNQLAVEISKREGKSKAVNIAQVKELVRITCDIFAEMSLWESMKLFFQMRKNGLDRFTNGRL